LFVLLKKKGGCKIVNFFVGFIVTHGEVIIVFDVQCLMYECWPENEFMWHIIVSPKNLHHFYYMREMCCKAVGCRAHWLITSDMGLLSRGNRIVHPMLRLISQLWQALVAEKSG
jgi:hypothetical protein